MVAGTAVDIAAGTVDKAAGTASHHQMLGHKMNLTAFDIAAGTAVGIGMDSGYMPPQKKKRMGS